MIITEEQVFALLELLALTRDTEPNCDDCLQHMAEFAETSLSGKSVPEAIAHIDEHLERCQDCREEFSALKDALGKDIMAS